MSESFALAGILNTLVQQSGPIPTGSVEQAIAAQSASLAKKITREASAQTYWTIRLLADRPFADGAYCAYAYFRWVDDVLDQGELAKEARLAFLKRQQGIIDRCYRGDRPEDLCPEEDLVADLIRTDQDQQSGLYAYISQMMAVMAFDVQRKGRLISHDELDTYTRSLATSVTEALHYFIGNGCAAPLDEARYHALFAAHITHMLRDALEDAQNGYTNIPHDALAAHDMPPLAVNSDAYQEWVKSQVNRARDLFDSGKANIAHVENLRCRLAGYAYVARFEVVLDAIEKDGYRLRAAYPERQSWRAALHIGLAALSQILQLPGWANSQATSRSNAIKGIA